jgi:hypothetical protein
MMTLTQDEISGISQIVTSSNIKFSKRVHAFTEQGDMKRFKMAFKKIEFESKVAAEKIVLTMGKR